MGIDQKTKDEITRGVELLWVCQDLQSEKDGIDRPRNHQIDQSKILDDFAKDISRSASNMLSLLDLFPMMDKLAALGQKLELENKVKMEYSDDYSKVALSYILEQHGIPE